LTEINNEIVADAVDVLPEEEVRICLFRLGEDIYAIPVELLIEIIKSQKIFPVPTTPSHVLGVINLRGNIVPIVDIRQALSIPQQSTPGQVAIVKHGSIMFGIVVDNVSAVISIPASSIQPLPSEPGPQHETRGRTSYLQGIVQRDTDVAALLSIERIIDAIKLT